MATTGGNDLVDRAQAAATARSLAEFACGLRFEDLPRQVVDHALLVIRDTLGTMLAGSTLPEVKGLASLSGFLSGVGRATLMGTFRTVSPHFAALVNGTGAVSLELDEGNQYAINHPSVHILPALLAIAEEERKSGVDLITAFVAGYEIAVRVGRVTHLRDSVHPFGTYMIIGAAAAASRLLALNVEETVQAIHVSGGICIASSQTAANSGASVRNLVTGLTGQNAILAPMAVRAGVTGETGALNIVFGSILGDRYRDDGLAADLGRDFFITRNYFKLHACSRWNHAPIEAAAAIREREGFSRKEVESVTVWTYNPATRLSWSNPANGYAAKHSIPYNVAVRLVRGTNDLDAYGVEVVRDKEVQAMAAKVRILEDPLLTAMTPAVRAARVEVKLVGGETLTETVEHPRGGFDRPYTEKDLKEKFNRLARMALAPSAVETLQETISALPELSDMTLMSPLLQGKS
jgi:2-methylcitrate dehydratase PrpD